MCYSAVVKGAMLFCVFSGTCFSAHSEALHISLKKAMEKRWVSVNAVSNGGYCDKSITLEVSNNTNKEMLVDVDPAMIFRPDEDTGAQNLVLLGNESLAIVPCGRTDVRLQTFCGKSYGHSPRPNLCYTYWKQGDSNLIKTLTHVKEHAINLHLAQQAVWSYTNGYSLHTIYSSSNKKESLAFVTWLAHLRHMPVPEFHMEYKLDSAIGSTHEVIVRNAKVHLNMRWKNDGYDRHMYLVIFKENGDVYKRIEGGQMIDKDGTMVDVEFDPVRDLKGRYVVKLYDDSHKVWDSKKVVVGMEPS